MTYRTVLLVDTSIGKLLSQIDAKLNEPIPGLGADTRTGTRVRHVSHAVADSAGGARTWTAVLVLVEP